MYPDPSNPVGWFDIPVTDMGRAAAFYEEVMRTTLRRRRAGSLDLALFPAACGRPGAAGALVCQPEWHEPSSEGVLVYFTSPTGDLDADLQRVSSAGGTPLSPKKELLSGQGHVVLFLDTEGNRVALVSAE